jgi:hypothetical protein
MQNIELTAVPSISAAEYPQPTLQDLECIIEKGKTNFLEVGEALCTIKTRELYKELGFPTWQAYLEVRWEFSRVHAFRLMQAWQLSETLPAGNKPKTEREARERLNPKPKSTADAEKLEAAFKKQVAKWETALPSDQFCYLLDALVNHLENLLVERDDRYNPEAT